MNQEIRNYLRESELRILGILNKYRRGLTWSELLRKTGYSKSTLSSALNYLKKMKLISKAIREDDKMVYRADISRSAVDTLYMIEEYIDYNTIEEIVKETNKDALFKVILDIFELVAAAFFTELEIEAMSSTTASEFKNRTRNVYRRITEASSKILDKFLKTITETPNNSFNTLKKKISIE